ncbi:STAS domain-containing protein [Actinotalea sp. Marseille-Q4924]|uniref:STAS domain-containing protein n=1 Tax=Actinotalea sp. Marseille-Q4924 TaxID=2866571 RepID=UPI001CE4A29D|nr:STAS domain-containing protein [Actinotalea sp. Marseille-Q4924]
MTDDDATTTLTDPSGPATGGAGDVGGIDVTEESGRTLVRMWGEVDAALRDQASLAMVECVRRALPVTVDAGRLTFIDSSGLAFVLQLHKVGQEDGTGIVLRDAPSLLLDLLEMIGMAGAIRLETTDGGPAVLAR